MKDLKEEEEKLKEEIFREYLKVSEETKEALCRVERKARENKKEKNYKDDREER